MACRTQHNWDGATGNGPCIIQGSSYYHAIQIASDVGPVSLIGWGVRSQLRNKVADDGDSLILATIDVTIVDYVARIVQFRLTPTQTQALTASEAYYDLEFFNGSEVANPIWGKATIDKEYTR